MIIHFDKLYTGNYFVSKFYTDGKLYRRRHMTLDIWERVQKTLEDKFKSIYTGPNENVDEFIFKDKGDEAYFLFWSHNGIEI